MTERELNSDSRVATCVCKINIAPRCVINAPNCIYVCCVFRRQPLDNHCRDYVLHTSSRTSKACLSAIRVIKTNKIARANALQAPTTMKRLGNQKQIEFLTFQSRQRRFDDELLFECAKTMRGVEVENDTLRVRTSIVRARESGRKTDGERDFWKHYDRFIASLQSEISTSSLGDSSPLYGTLHRCTLPIAQPVQVSTNLSLEPACYLLDRRLIAELLVGIYFTTRSNALFISFARLIELFVDR